MVFKTQTKSHLTDKSDYRSPGWFLQQMCHSYPPSSAGKASFSQINGTFVIRHKVLTKRVSLSLWGKLLIRNLFSLWQSVFGPSCPLSIENGEKKYFKYQHNLKNPQTDSRVSSAFTTGTLSHLKQKFYVESQKWVIKGRDANKPLFAWIQMEDGPQAQPAQHLSVSGIIVIYSSWYVAFYFNKSAERISFSLLAWHDSIEMFNHTSTVTIILVQTTNEISSVPYKAHLLAQTDFRGANSISVAGTAVIHF